MHDTQPMGQRDVRQREKAKGMTPQTANANGLADAFEDSLDFVLLLDERGNITYANHSARRLLQNAEPDYLNSPYSDIEIKPENDRYLRLVTNTPRNYSDGTCYWRRPVGNPLAVNCRFTTIETPEKSVTLVIAQKQETASSAKLILEGSDSNLQRIFEDSGIGMILLGPDAVIHQSNKAFSSILGYSDDTLDNINLLTILHPNDIELVQDMLDAWQPGERFVSQIETRFFDADGRPIWTLMTVSAISTSSSEPPVAVAQIQDITDQQLTVQALRISQERFLGFASAASDWMWEMGPDLKFSYFSRRLTELTGISSLKLLGRTLDETNIAQNSDEAAYRELFNCLHARQPFRRFVYRQRLSSGETAWLSVSGAPIITEDGEFQGYRGTGTDITDRVEAEEALKNSEERMRRSINDAPVPAMIHAEDGEILTINAIWSQISGYPHAEIPTIDTWIRKTYPATEYKTLHEAIQNLYTIEQRQANGIRQIKTKNGATRLWDFQSSPLGHLPDGRRYVITMAVDITDRMEAQAQLRVLSRATDQSKSAIAIADREGTIQYVNRQYSDMTGYAPEETIGAELTTLFFDNEGQISSQIHQALADRGSWGNSRLNIRKTGEKYWESVTVFNVLDDTDTTTHIAVIKEDITAIKRTEFELESAIERTEIANQAKSAFLANMSHELRTPMNAIIGFSEAIAQEMFGPIGCKRYQEYIGDIQSSAYHLLGIINDILDISKIEAGKLDLEAYPVDVGLTARSSLELLRPRLENAGVKSSMDFAADLPKLLGDERAIKQILLNLLSNAVKFTPKNGRINVCGRINDDGRFEVSISDTGIGMDQSEIESVLLPFGQGDSAMSMSPEGTGLGLSISKSLIELHDGELILESQINQGTTVRVLFPEARQII